MLVAATISAACARTASGEVLPEGWEFRRPLVFRQILSDAPGENIAWAEFYTNGKQRPDGADFRVTNSDRMVMPIKLLQVSKDNDFVRLAFASRGDGPYFVWWGNPKAEKPAKDLEIKRGILVDVMRAGTEGITTKAAPLASFFINDMSLGYNPLGDDHNVVMHYSAAFKIDRAIKPQMAFTVSDVGLLAIDGQTVAQERGGLKARVRMPFPLDLAAGWHTLDIRQINTNQAAVAMALVWERPGESVYTTLPPSLFAQAAHAVPGNLEKIGAAFTSDFSLEPTAEGFIPPSNYPQRYIFEAQIPASMKPTITWDFGDGQTAQGLKNVSHIFLAPGTYPVTLRLDLAAAGSAPVITTTRLEIKDRMYARFPRPAEDPPKTVQAVLKDYDPKKLPAAQAFLGLSFFDSIKDDDSMIVWGKGWLAQKETLPLPDGVVSDEAFAVARVLQGRGQYKDAAEVFRLASLKPVSMDARTKLMWQEVMTLCDDVDDANAALQEAQSWETKIDPEIKTQAAVVKVAEAYAAMAKGDGKVAKAAIDAAVAAGGDNIGAGGAGNISPANAGADFSAQEIKQGVLARNIENYIRTRDYDTAWQLINEWELEFPQTLWEGFSRTLRVRLAAAQGRFLAAARLALSHARANPDGFYAAELLFRASENFKQGGQGEQSKTAMDLLKSKYPESPYARQ